MSYRTNQLNERIIELLKQGVVGFMPSDTIYGLSCIALDERAVERIHKLKKRDSDKPMIVLVSDISQLSQLGVDQNQASLAGQHWPGALTLICQASEAPQYLHRGTKSLAIRYPDDSELCKLISLVGPIISTSANIQGDQPASSIGEAWKYFGEELDFYVDLGDYSERLPSTLVKAVGGKLKVIRPGAVKI